MSPRPGGLAPSVEKRTRERRTSRLLPPWFLAAACAVMVACGEAPLPDVGSSEEAYRWNNRGVALLEQFDYDGAAEAFREALAIHDSLGIARLNLALALYHGQDLEGAEREALDARRRLPTALQPPYLLGLIARSEGRVDDAVTAFTTVLAADPNDVGANINLGQIHLEAQEYPAAITRLEAAYEAEPFNVTAVYALGLAAARSGETERGRRLLEEAQRLRSTPYAVTYGSGYLNEGRYTEAMVSTGTEPGLIDPTVPATDFAVSSVIDGSSSRPPEPPPFGRRFTADELSPTGGARLAAGLGGGITPIDFDEDGDLDLFAASINGQRLVRNDGSDGWVDVTEGSGLRLAEADGVPIGAAAADYDNDHHPDLFVLRFGRSSLYRGDGDGGFQDVTDAANLPPYPYLPGGAAFADVDHDGDVDLIVVGLADIDATRAVLGSGQALFPQEFAPAPMQLLRNNLDGTFTDVTEAARLDAAGHALAVVPTDFDNRRDVDLLVVNHDTSPRLLMNQRDSSFRDVAAETGLSDLGNTLRAVSTADVNKDQFPDFLFVGDAGAVLALSDGRGRFTLERAPGELRGGGAVRFLDYDNDGLSDLLVWSADVPRLWRNVGDDWIEVTQPALRELPDAPLSGASALAVADIDGDGDSDIVATERGTVVVASNRGTPGHQSLRLTLRGLASNRLGIGAKAQIRAGSLRSRLELSAAAPAVAPADLVFGLGPRPGADVARVLWPSGILQAEIPKPPVDPGRAGAQRAEFLPTSLVVEELDREPSSCPFLFTWNGTEFEFVTDFLGGGEMGYWHGPGVYNTPDPVEYVRIRDDQLVAKDGRFELRLTNELEEAVFFDHLQLIALTHAADVTVYPNEGMAEVPKPHRLHAVRDASPPLRALADDGTDVTDQLSRLDRHYAEGFPLTGIRGYAGLHALTLDLGPRPGPTVLLLTGWTDYAFSSDNLAAAQAGLAPRLPTLEVKDRDGRWRAIADVGLPVGRPQTIAIDLSGRLRAGEREVRVVTNMRVYWDQAVVASPVPVDGLEPHVLEPVRATLRDRGFSAEAHPWGTEPPTYDYASVSNVSPWKTLVGRYTRVGDVLELLTAADDMFVITKGGDELVVSFESTTLPDAPPGFRRTYLLRADGYSKEMDINSASPDTVEPLPFHAMSRYPYEPPDAYPDTPAHRQYRERYNTRAISKAMPPLNASSPGSTDPADRR